ncbi:hypothetical protein ACE1N8_21880 [Streptomyces sp. DSM 116494]|uniref:hypothetical protein n=1 Tax=Streptomyces okerensis TaxID=3344655 RepID=UPI00388F01A7
MADEQYRWLDRGTAERLLSGEPPEAADPTTRDQAERLAATLHALAAPPPSADGGLCGEAAALAAFRKLREEREGRAAPVAAAGHRAGTADSDGGLVRIGAPRGETSGTAGGARDPRPLRYGLAAALVAGLVGGAAVLAAAGVLPTPSGESGTGPAASASPTHPERPLLSLPPESGGATPGGRHPGSGTGEHGAEARSDGGAGAGRPGAPENPGPDSGDPGARSGRSGKQLASACRALRDGKNLNRRRERLLEDAAGGPAGVGPYCADALSSGEGGSGAGPAQGKGTDADTPAGGDDGKGHGKSGGNGKSGDNGKSAGKGNSDSSDSGPGPGKGNGGSSGGNGKKGQGAGQGQGQGAGNSESQGNKP